MYVKMYIAWIILPLFKREGRILWTPGICIFEGEFNFLIIQTGKKRKENMVLYPTELRDVIWGFCHTEERGILYQFVYLHNWAKMLPSSAWHWELVAPTGLEPATTRLTVEVTLIYDTVWSVLLQKAKSGKRTGPCQPGFAPGKMDFAIH